MKKTVLAFLLIISVCNAEEPSEGFSGFFRFNDGSRIDYSSKNPTGKLGPDSMSDKALLSIAIPENSRIATFNLTYGSDADTIRPDDDWQGVVAQRGKSMITIVCDHSEGNSQREKVSTYVIFTEKRVGFCITHSAWLGRPEMEGNLALPFGSACILRLTQIGK
jgi:hypothetical protein